MGCNGAEMGGIWSLSFDQIPPIFMVWSLRNPIERPGSRMAQADFRLVGCGLYSPPEASRLTGVPIRRINRWTRGYWFVHRGRRQWSEPVIGLSIRKIINAPALDFADLIEVRFLSLFRDHKIGWPAIRLAAKRAKEVLQTPHPFSSQRFSTDGRTILAELVDRVGDRHLLDLVHNQWEFERVVVKFLRKGLHYDGRDGPQWWSPLGEDRKVILHPARAFGAPIVTPSSIRTQILYSAYQAEGSHEAVAHWYNVDPGAVADAVEFEASLRPAA